MWNTEQRAPNGEFDKRAALAQIEKMAKHGQISGAADIMLAQIIRTAQYAMQHCAR